MTPFKSSKKGPVPFLEIQPTLLNYKQWHRTTKLIPQRLVQLNNLALGTPFSSNPGNQKTELLDLFLVQFADLSRHQVVDPKSLRIRCGRCRFGADESAQQFAKLYVCRQRGGPLEFRLWVGLAAGVALRL